MARHPRIEACMFCGAFPCECEPVAPKKAPARKKAKPSSTPVSPSGDGSPETSTVSSMVEEPDGPAEFRPPTDAIRAAMKQAAQPPDQQSQDELLESGVRFVDYEEWRRERTETLEGFAPAIAALGPILSRHDKRIYRDIINRPDLRAALWRERHAE